MGTVNMELISGDLDSEIMKIYFGQCIMCIMLAVMLLTLNSLVTELAPVDILAALVTLLLGHRLAALLLRRGYLDIFIDI